MSGANLGKLVPIGASVSELCELTEASAPTSLSIKKRRAGFCRPRFYFLPRQMLDEVVDKLHPQFDLADLNKLIGLVRLGDRARPADHGRQP